MAGMSGSPIFPSDAVTAYRVFFTSAVYYGVEAISLNRKQEERINKAWTIPWLHRLGISSKANVNIRHMNREDAGLELYKVQDVMTIKRLNIYLAIFAKVVELATK